MEIRTAHQYSLLSEASYADFDTIGAITQTDVENALIAREFSNTQAAEFITHWQVVHHLPNTSTGFSATVFESLDSPGKYVFAIRGTEPGQWIIDIALTDIADIGADGIALKQAIDLYNYYLQLTTPAGELTPQYEVYEGTLIPPVGTDYVVTGLQYRYLRTIDPEQGLGVIPYNSGPIDVTGHSLGGHLALILSRLDPNRVGEVYTYNAPGFDTGIIGSDDTEWFFRAMAQIEMSETGMTTVGSFPIGRIDNMVATNDIVSNIGYVPGNITPFANEGDDGISAHDKRNVSDVLAVFNLYAALDPTADLTDDLTPIFMATRNADELPLTLETMARELSSLLSIRVSDIPKDDRNALYQAIQAIESEIYVDRTVGNPQVKPAYQNLEVVSLPNLTRTETINRANNDIAYRYALAHLNPFVITGRESLYDNHNQNNELELYDPITQTGEITQAYLESRSAFLALLNQGNVTGEPVPGEDVEFYDVTRDIIARYDNYLQPPHRIYFGGDQGEALSGMSNHDRLFGGGGDDTLNGNAGDDYLEGNAGTDRLNGGVGDDELHGGSGNDGGIIHGLYGDAGDDALYGEAGDDTLDGGTERDLLVGGYGQDHLIGGDDHDFLIGGFHYHDVDNNFFHIFDDGEIDRLEGGNGDDVYWAGAGDIINDTDGKGRINLNVTFDSGAQAYLTLGEWGIRQGATTNEYIECNEAYDYTIHYRYDEVTQTLTVNDSLTIENFNNFDFVIGLGSPSVRLLFADSYWFSHREDGSPKSPEEYFASFDPSWMSELQETAGGDVEYVDDNIIGTDGDDEIDSDAGDDLVIAGDGDDLVHGGLGNDELRGDAGDDWLYGDDGNDRLLGGEGMDRLFGGLGDDILRGGLGNGDVLNGGRGNDIYYFAAGDGNITINNFDNVIGRQDVLRFLDGVSAVEVTATRLDYNLILSHTGSGETITVTDYFVGDGVGYSLDLIEFADGVQWDVDQIKTQVQQGTDGDDNLYGYAEADTLDGLAGNDTLYGMNGDDILSGGTGNDGLSGGNDNDQLLGGEGNDALHGNAGNDTLFGGAGTDEIYGGDGDDRMRGDGGIGDILNGGAGNDTYLFGAGDGDTTIQNHDTGTGRRDVLQFVDAIQPGDIQVSRSNYDLLLTLQSSGEVITVTGYFLEENGWTHALDEIRFEDGTSWGTDTILAMALQASEGDDTIFGYSGADTIEGLGGHDSLVGEAGNDTLLGGAGNDYLYGGAGNDRLEGGAGNDGLSGDEGDDYLIGGEGQDALFGGAGNDTLECGQGNCSGGAGNDTYIHRVGSGDMVIDNADPDGTGQDVLIIEGVDSNSVTFGRSIAAGSEGDLILSYVITDAQGSITSEAVSILGYFEQSGTTGQAIDHITFDDLSLDAAAIRVKMSQGTEGQESLYADDSGSILHGLGGNDNLYGMAGNDELYGGAGSDSLQGGGGDDILAGGEGVDRLSGNGGSDTYLFNIGDGHDGIYESVGSDSDGVNTIRLGEGLTRENVNFQSVQPTGGINFSFEPSYVDLPGQSLLIESRDTDDSLYVSNYFLDPARNTDGYDYIIEFNDGSRITKQEMAALFTQTTDGDDRYLGDNGANNANLLAGDDLAQGFGGDDVFHGDAGNDWIDGAAGNDELHGGNGDDQLIGNGGNDQLYGGAGDDELSGGAGDDTLRGGPGNDQLTDTGGNDVYLFAKGDGLCTIDNQNTTHQDVLRFLAGVTPAEVVLARDGRDLTITLQGGDDRITVSGYFIEDVSDGYVLDAIEFADGTVWDGQGIWDRFSHATAGDDLLFADEAGSVLDGLAGDDSLMGAQGSDQLSGGDGNDLIQGQGGDDTLHGNAGNDHLFGDAGNDQLNGGSGQDVVHGGDGDDYLIASSGINTLAGGLGSDTYGLTTGIGQNTIQNYNGSDYTSEDKIVFAEGIVPGSVLLSRIDNDLVLEYAGAVTQVENYFTSAVNNRIGAIEFQDGTSWSYDDVRAMLLLATDMDDHLVGYETDDLIDGGAGNDTISGAAGNDQLLGGAGSDLLDGGDGNDQLDGGAGNDTLTGANGDDRYLFRTGHGQDTINDLYGNNTIEFTDLASTDAMVQRDGNNLVISNLNSTDQVTVIGQLNGPDSTNLNNSISEVVFSNGVILTVGELFSQLATSSGGDDNIQGFNTAETIDGRAGNDTIRTFGGADNVQGGDGIDQIDGGTGNDTLVGGLGDDTLDGSAGDDLLDGGAGNDLLYGDGDMDHYGPGHSYDETAHDQLFGGDGDDRLYGGSRYELDAFRDENFDILHGGAGGDYLYGQGELYGDEGADELIGNGILDGGDGNDSIKLSTYGGLVSTTINGGVGDDSLIGSYIGATYTFNLGDGADLLSHSLSDATASAMQQDVILFGAGITQADVRFEQQQNSLIVSYGSGNDQVTVTDWFISQGRGKTLRFEFADGSVITDFESLLTTPGSGDGGTQPGSDPTPDNPPNDSGDNGGDTFTPPQPGGADALLGSAADETLIAGAGNDTLAGGLGNDRLLGGEGDDTYIYTGGQDTLEETAGLDRLVFENGITFSQVASGLLKSGDDLVLRVNGGPEQITLRNFFLGGNHLLETIEFATGGSLTADQIFGAFGLSVPAATPGFSQTIDGTSANDTLSGADQADSISGYNGDDSLIGGAGDDRLEGSNGADTLTGGRGNDQLVGGRGDDTYIFTAGDGQDYIDNQGGGLDTLRFEGIGFNQVASGLMRSGDNLILRVSGSSDQVTLQDYFKGGDHAVDRIVFTSGGELTSAQLFSVFGLTDPDPAGSPNYPGLPDERNFTTITSGSAGNDIYLAGSDADFIDAGAGDDMLNGGLGNDYLIGGYGSDTYLIGADSGQDVINNFDADDTGVDTLQFESAVIEDLWFSRAGNDLTITQAGTDNQVTLAHWYDAPSNEVDRIEAAGSVLLNNQVDQLVTAMAAYNVPAGVGNVIPQDVKDSLQPLLAANWQAIA
ncbi:MAG: calcium-binding protein [Candidatus Thiodiazotropha sp.]